MLRGDFNAGASDPAWQTIPTAWIKAAQARWKARDAKGQMTAVGLTPRAEASTSPLSPAGMGNWFDEIVTAPGAVTRTARPRQASRSRWCAMALVSASTPSASDRALDFLIGLNLNVLAVVGSESSAMTTKAGNLRMRNRRAEMYWRCAKRWTRTAPDPIALPPDPDLLADLAAVRYKVVTMGKVAAIQMRDKDEIREALGRSPDKGDAIAMTFVDGIPPPGAASSRYDEPSPPDWRT